MSSPVVGASGDGQLGTLHCRQLNTQAPHMQLIKLTTRFPPAETQPPTGVHTMPCWKPQKTLEVLEPT